MDKLSGVFLDAGSLDKNDLDFSELRDCFCEFEALEFTQADKVVTTANHAEVIVCNKTCLTQEILEQLPRLRLICVCATGTNNIDLGAADFRNVLVCNVTHYATASVVQHAFLLMLNLSTHFLQYHQLVKQGKWQQSRQFCLLDFQINELAGKTLGIIGYGDLGKGMAKMGEAFGMRVLIAEHRGAQNLRPGRTSFDALIKDSDFITLHCPLTPETQHLIGPEQLAAMKQSAIVLNVARGGIVDENALLSALQNGLIAGAGVDVLNTEPPVDGNPLLAADLPNLIVTPHIAWATKSARIRLMKVVVENIKAFLNNKPQNVVNPG